ncbi:MAG: cyclic nucleotide-binding domain-containing protein [Thermodesulfobacteriota bacterium]|nr:cyclic nucleotide-binding domain-containing protein [Thermodesulfobacteriota bacterium]
MDKAVLTGDLEFLSLGDLIQLIGSNGSTGILRILSKFVEAPGIIYFREGNPVEASKGAENGLQVLYSLFGWTEGEFEFKAEPVDLQGSIKQSRMEIILEGLRLLDDGQIERKGAFLFDAEADQGGDTTRLPLIKGPLIDYMDVVAEEDFHEGQTIVNQGRHGTWMWVILEGQVNICKEVAGEMVPILKIGAGSFIGSMSAFAQQDEVRSATAVAADRVQLGVLDRQRLTHEFSCLSYDFRNVILSLDKRLKQVTRLAATSRLNRQKLKDVTRGKMPIIREGDSQNRLLSIKEGNAFIVRSLSKGDLVLAKLEKRDFVGHIPFLNVGHEPDSAAVYGTDDLNMQALQLELLEDEYNRLSGTMKNMLDNFATFVSATTGILNSLQTD